LRSTAIGKNRAPRFIGEVPIASRFLSAKKRFNRFNAFFFCSTTVVKVLFATGRSYLPHLVGGAALSVHTLLGMLIEHGHSCEAVTGLFRGWRRKAMRGLQFLSLGRRYSLRDRRNGYPCYRTSRRLVPALAEQRIAAFKPDILITQLESANEIARIALDSGVPTVLNVHDADFDKWTWPAPHPRLRLVSCSRYIAQRLRERLGFESAVIHPFIRRADYQVDERVPEFVTLINPVPEKGLELALEIASLLPARRFLFVETWPLGRHGRPGLLRRLDAFSNVTFVPWSLNMKSIYVRTAVILMPSQCEEGFGRVILEAQMNGIPVLGRAIGAIPEVLASSGTLFPADAPARAWADEIERMLTDDAWCVTRSAAACVNAARKEFDVDGQLESFLALAADLGSYKVPKAPPPENQPAETASAVGFSRAAK
jgi:glycosyltransferase involved in cell wall biosynthesis